MKKKYRFKCRKLATATLAVLLLGGLAACGSSQEVQTEPKVEQEGTTASQTAAPETPAPETSAQESKGSGTAKIKGTEKAEETAEEVHQPYLTESDGAAVYMTREISPEALQKVYEALGREATGKVAVKLSVGEAGAKYYLSPDLIKDLIQDVDGTIVDCNTAYGGRRASTALHLQVAEDHGFTAVAPVDILDAEDTISLPVTGGKHLQEDIVGAGYENYDFVMVLSHFKGHEMGGFGGALKNISIGFASSDGKNLIHSAGNSLTSWNGSSQNTFVESMAEAASAITKDRGENILYINVMNNLSIDCDCSTYPAKPSMEDIGILASLDPVALDQACVDLVYAAGDGESLIKRMESRNGLLILKHAEEMGAGNRKYHLVNLDDSNV